MTKFEHLKVVVASPNDIQNERESLSKIINDINQEIANLKVYLELLCYENDAFPGFHKYGSQGLIDEILKIKDCDIFICIFWKKFGTPTKYESTGTEHEFKQAYEAWKNNEQPHIMMYFNKSKIDIPKDEEELQQLRALMNFKKNLPKEGFWWSYDGIDDFKIKVHLHIKNYLLEKYDANSSTLQTTHTHSELSEEEIEKIFKNYREDLRKKVSKIRLLSDGTEHDLTNVFVDLRIAKQYDRPSYHHRTKYENIIDLKLKKPLHFRDFYYTNKQLLLDQSTENIQIKPDDLLKLKKKYL